MNPLHLMARSVSRAEDLLKRHPRRLTAAVVVGLLGTAVTAFGVAPMAPDAADLPRRLLTESVTPADLSEQLEALELHELALYRTDLTRSSDTADSLLRRLGVDDPEAAAFLRSDVTARRLLEGRAGKMVQVQTENGRLAQLVSRSPAADSNQFNTHFTRLTVGRDNAGLHAKTEQVPLQAEVRLGSGTILSSLFAAADESRIPDSVTVQMAELFSADIDFRRELRKGDTFSVLYEALTADGEPITWNQAAGRVLAAQFVNGGKTFDAVWFQEPGSKGGYFGLDGQSKQRFFLASPMAFSRVTSGFAMRMHPIHKTWRAHLGVDYGAPTGTPVRAVGDGTIEFAGVQNGYGNVVVVQHPGNRQTLYAHLSRINVRKGQRVSQSDTVGLVGATGWATGPHLHFEFKVGGKQVNPMSIARSSEAVTISAGARAQFNETAAIARAQLTAAPAVASARIE